MDPLRGHLLLSLRLGPHRESELRVRALRGLEGLSTPFHFEVELFPTSGEPLELPPLLAAEAVLSLARPGGATRWVNGVCAGVEHAGVIAGRPVYRATVVPKLALLDQTADTRVFQDVSAVDIVKQLLDARGIAHREALAGVSPVREMCLQYRESDLAFVSRLLEAEGIFYWFEHAEDRHVMVLSDRPDAFPALEGGEAIPFRAEREHVVDLEQLLDLHTTRRVKPVRAALRDYDFERPALEVGGEAAQADGAEVYDWPAGAVDPAQVNALGRVRLEELRVAAETWEGEGTCARLVPGAVFAAQDHPDPAFRTRLVAVRVEHRGEQATEQDATQVGQPYRSRFLAVPAGAPYRPARTTPRPRIAGVQTATAVGPAGEEIHPDRYGRIKVQFHWDREGKRDDGASAWVRTAQAWGGPSFGALFVPRAGQEVLVRFLEGDPDRPLVTGALYNGGNPAGADLPGERTRAHLRTDSSPHSGGYNELAFEDQQGAEQVQLRAQKDERLETERDKEQHVRANERLEVGKDRSRTIGGDQRLEVALDDGRSIGGNQALRVGSDRTVAVLGAHQEEIAVDHGATVGGARDVTVHGTSVETVGAASTLTVGGAYAVSVAAAENVAVGGLLLRTVGGDVREWVGAERSAEVKGSDAHTVGGKDVLDVRGAVSSSAERDLSEKVERTFGVEAGEAVDWQAQRIRVEAETLNLVVGGKRLLSLSGGQVTFGAATFTASGTSVALKGSSVAKLGPAAPPGAAPEVSRAEKLDPKRPLVRVRVTDKATGAPLVNVRVRVEMPDGSVRVVRSNEEGVAVASAPREGRVKFTLVDHHGSTWGKR